jgi:hypothetical protein
MKPHSLASPPKSLDSIRLEMSSVAASTSQFRRMQNLSEPLLHFRDFRSSSVMTSDQVRNWSLELRFQSRPEGLWRYEPVKLAPHIWNLRIRPSRVRKGGTAPADALLESLKKSTGTRYQWRQRVDGECPPGRSKRSSPSSVAAIVLPPPTENAIPRRNRRSRSNYGNHDSDISTPDQPTAAAVCAASLSMRLL